MSALTADEEFWTNVDVREMRDCWRWRDLDSYGTFCFNGTSIAAHRYAWRCTYGEIPTGLLVLHGCDNSWCVNPRHLRLGTIEDNNRDKCVLTRAREAIASAQRKREEVVAGPAKREGSTATDKSRIQETFGGIIRRLRSEMGWSLSQFARELNVPKSCVSKWENGESGTPMKRLPNIAALLGCSVADLLVERDTSIHGRIAELRRRAGLTQSELAASLGIHKTAVSHWENGVSRPDVDHLPTVARVLGVTVDALLSGVDQ